jgi:hypothetical protein
VRAPADPREALAGRQSAVIVSIRLAYDEFECSSRGGHHQQPPSRSSTATALAPAELVEGDALALQVERRDDGVADDRLALAFELLLHEIVGLDPFRQDPVQQRSGPSLGRSSVADDAPRTARGYWRK